MPNTLCPILLFENSYIQLQKRIKKKVDKVKDLVTPPQKVTHARELQGKIFFLLFARKEKEIQSSEIISSGRFFVIVIVL